jgi:hypothetical protein
MFRPHMAIIRQTFNNYCFFFYFFVENVYLSTDSLYINFTDIASEFHTIAMFVNIDL